MMTTEFSGKDEIIWYWLGVICYSAAVLWLLYQAITVKWYYALWVGYPCCLVAVFFGQIKKLKRESNHGA